MSTSNPISHYALGNTDAEHERLIRQAMILAPLTERFFRQAGIGPGQRVLPLGSACASLIRESLERSGGDTEMGLTLYRTFQEAGLPAPTLQMEIPVGDNPAAVLWIYDLFCTLLPQMQQFNLSLEGLGNAD